MYACFFCDFFFFYFGSVFHFIELHLIHFAIKAFFHDFPSLWSNVMTTVKKRCQ